MHDLTGRRYGQWTVLERDWTKKTRDGNIYWRCRCSCGVRLTVRGAFLRTGKSTKCKSCATTQARAREAEQRKSVTKSTIR